MISVVVIIPPCGAALLTRKGLGNQALSNSRPRTERSGGFA
ncbi:IlvGEDA operon leader peptide [Salmonella enterica subsp. enterica]|nr:IlvGEDA operon leader peptide [Salmonella enterica subsp. enterica]